MAQRASLEEVLQSAWLMHGPPPAHEASALEKARPLTLTVPPTLTLTLTLTLTTLPLPLALPLPLPRRGRPSAGRATRA